MRSCNVLTGLEPKTRHCGGLFIPTGSFYFCFNEKKKLNSPLVVDLRHPIRSIELTGDSSKDQSTSGNQKQG